MADYVKIPCPKCQEKQKLLLEHLGRRLTCGGCRHKFWAEIVMACPACCQGTRVKIEAIGTSVLCEHCAHRFEAVVGISCPWCRRHLKIKPRYVGRSFSCKGCDRRSEIQLQGNQIVVFPSAQSPSSTPPAAAPEQVETSTGSPDPTRAQNGAELSEHERCAALAQALGSAQQELQATLLERDRLQVDLHNALREAERYRSRTGELERTLAETEAAFAAAQQERTRELGEAARQQEAERTVPDLRLQADLPPREEPVVTVRQESGRQDPDWQSPLEEHHESSQPVS
jgi:hypothetical protein